MDFDEYEKLPSGSTTTHMVAGAFAGIMEHCVMYPLDSVKTRMQSLRPNPNASYRNVPEALIKMVRYEGVFRPMRGMSAVVAGAGPAHSLYFSSYEKLKRLISGTEHGYCSPLAQGLAGCFATLLHDAIMNPAEVVKQRMQMYNSPYQTCSECFAKVWKTEGARAFYRSYTTQLTMNIPFQSIHFMTYEFLQDVTNHKRTYNPKAHMLSGAISGAFAAAVTTPLDVCKTLLNTQEQNTVNYMKHNHINGLISAAATVYRYNGIRGYFQGLQARVIYQVPSTAIAWTVYEFFKYFIEKRHRERHVFKQENVSFVSHSNSLEKQTVHIPVSQLPIAYSEQRSI